MFNSVTVWRNLIHRITNIDANRAPRASRTNLKLIMKSGKICKNAILE